MDFRRHWVFFVALVLWTASSLLMPTWIGRSYSKFGTGKWHESGVFGLEGGDGWYKISPMWSPPRAQATVNASVAIVSPKAGGEPAPIESREIPTSHPPRFETTVHWPLTPNPGGSVIEVCWTVTLLRLFAGVAVLGALLRAWTWVTRSVPDATVAAIWKTTLSIAVSLVAFGAITIFSFGTLFTDGIAALVLGAGAILGIVYAAKTRHESPASGMATGSAQATTNPASQSPPSSVATFLLGVFHFLLGLTASVVLLIVAAWSVRSFRGPVRGVNEMGGAIYAEDQTSIQLAAGAGMLIGGIAAAAMLRSVTRTPRAFAWGLAVGATILGVCVAFGM